MSPANHNSAMIHKMSTASKTFRKPSPASKIKNCVHVDPGAVWCPICASNYRSQAREDYDKALSQSSRGDVIRAARTILSNALLEFALSDAGAKEMEAEYLRLAGLGDFAAAERMHARLKEFAKQASVRNQQARRDQIARNARMNTMASVSQAYVAPPVDKNGQYTMAGCTHMYTNHARERMEQRHISADMVSAGMSHYTAIMPGGSGRWNVTADNGLKICGFFEKYSDNYLFVVMTVFRIGIDKQEADEL